jgi:hypothetical protein
VPGPVVSKAHLDANKDCTSMFIILVIQLMGKLRMLTLVLSVQLP